MLANIPRWTDLDHERPRQMGAREAKHDHPADRIRFAASTSITALPINISLTRIVNGECRLPIGKDSLFSGHHLSNPGSWMAIPRIHTRQMAEACTVTSSDRIPHAPESSVQTNAGSDSTMLLHTEKLRDYQTLSTVKIHSRLARGVDCRLRSAEAYSVAATATSLSEASFKLRASFTWSDIEPC